MILIEVSAHSMCIHTVDSVAMIIPATEFPGDPSGVSALIQWLQSHAASQPIWLLTDSHDDQLMVSTLPEVRHSLRSGTKHALIRQLQGDARYTNSHGYKDSGQCILRHYQCGNETVLCHLVEALGKGGYSVRGVAPVALVLEMLFNRHRVKAQLSATALVVTVEINNLVTLVRCYFFQHARLVYQRVVPLEGEALNSPDAAFAVLRATHEFLKQEYDLASTGGCPVYCLSSNAALTEDTGLIAEPAAWSPKSEIDNQIDSQTDSKTGGQPDSRPDSRPVSAPDNSPDSAIIFQELPVAHNRQALSDIASSERLALLVLPELVAAINPGWSVLRLTPGLGRTAYLKQANCMAQPAIHVRWRRSSLARSRVVQGGLKILSSIRPNQRVLILMLSLQVILGSLLWQRWREVALSARDHQSLNAALLEADSDVPAYSLSQLQSITESHVVLQQKTQSPHVIVQDLATLLGHRPAISLESLSWRSSLSGTAFSVDDRVTVISDVIIKGNVQVSARDGKSLTSIVYAEFEALIQDLTNGAVIADLQVSESPVLTVGEHRLLQTDDSGGLSISGGDFGEHTPAVYLAPFTIELTHVGYVS